jgi:Bacterial low temperature requirement A protein (LtrA)
VFVAAVSQLATGLARDPSAATFARFAGLFVAVAWAWTGFTMYANRFDTDDLIFRLAKSGAMLAVAAVAVNLHSVVQGRGGTAGFAAGYAVVRSLLVVLYIRARLHVRGPGRRLVDLYIANFTLTTMLWVVSIFVPEPYRIILWGLALAIDLAIPPRGWRALAGAPIVASHVTERYGTFFIIVLGESVVAVVAGVAGFEFSFQSWVVAPACFVVALCLWWIYFDLADTSVLGRGVLGIVYLYGHSRCLRGWPPSGRAPSWPSRTPRILGSARAPDGPSLVASRHSRRWRYFISLPSGPPRVTQPSRARSRSRVSPLRWRRSEPVSLRWRLLRCWRPWCSDSCCSRPSRSPRVRPACGCRRSSGNRPRRASQTWPHGRFS